MKIRFLIMSGLLFALGTSMAQCTIDPHAQTTPGISPPANQLPCIERNTPYDQVLQVQNISGLGPGGAISVDSFQLTAVNGLPNGINWDHNPDKLYAGQNGCMHLYGSTPDPVGKYTLAWIGTVWFTAPFIGSQTYNGDLTRYGGPSFQYSLYVIDAGEQCTHAVGINDVSPDLNAAMDIYPNPNNGVFEFKLNAAKRVNGEMTIVDMTGRTIYSEKLDVIGLYNTSIDLSRFARGLYTLQLRTADGVASKRISIQ